MDCDFPETPAGESNDEPVTLEHRYDAPHREPRPPMFVRLDNQWPDDEQT